MLKAGPGHAPGYLALCPGQETRVRETDAGPRAASCSKVILHGQERHVAGTEVGDKAMCLRPGLRPAEA